MKELVFRRKVDVDVAEMYADTKCKKCNGKGYIVAEVGEYDTTIRKDRPIKKIIYYCSCVDKTAKKYG